VLFIDHTAMLGGGEIALLNLVTHLDATRYLPVVLLLQDGPLRAKLDQAGVETHLYQVATSVLSARKDTLGVKTLLRARDVAGALVAVLGIARRIRALDVDLIHTNSLKADIMGGVAARFCGKLVIWHVRDRIDSDYLPGIVVKTFRRLSKLIPSWVIANSGATLNTLQRNARSSAAIPSGFAIDPFWDVPSPPLPQLRDGDTLGGRAVVRVVHDGTLAVSDSLSAPPVPGAGAIDAARSDRPRVALVGRITRWKGQHIFLQAAAWAHRIFPNARFQIAGAALFDERDYDAQIRAVADELNGFGYVEFLGFVGNIPEFMAGIDVLVHASITGEPFGQVIIEAMAAGKPVVATNGGGVPEIVVHGETGLLVPMGDSAAMADAVCQLLADPPRARKMGDRGRQRVLEHFTIGHTVDKVQNVYDELLAR
jgi:glycosyltransferase involved in cell wall biosynthesis